MKFNFGGFKTWLAKLRAGREKIQKAPKLPGGNGRFSEIKNKFADTLYALKQKVQDRGAIKPTNSDTPLPVIHAGANPPKNIGDLINKYKLYINCTAITICAYLFADFVAAVILPLLPENEIKVAKPAPMKEKVSLAQYQLIYRRNLFNKDGKIPAASEIPINPNTPAVKTSLPLNLLGTIILRDKLKSVASVEDRSARHTIAVRVNELITPSAVVTKIESNKVIFFNKRAQRNEYIDIPQKELLNIKTRSTKTRKSSSKGIRKVSENHLQIDRTEVDKAIGNIAKVLQDARCVPNIENGRPAGFRCFQIVPDSIYDRLGLKNGDVICGINGQPINDPGTAFQKFNELKTAKQVELCISRNGSQRTMTYDIQ